MAVVPTLCIDHLAPAQVRAFMIADNRLTEIASCEDRLLAEQLKELSLLISISASSSPVLKWAKSICASHRSRKHPSQLTTPPMPYPRSRQGRHSLGDL